MVSKLHRVLCWNFSEGILIPVFLCGFVCPYWQDQKRLPFIGESDPKEIFKAIIKYILVEWYADKNYDEVILRQYMDNFSKYFRILTKILINYSAFWSTFMTLAGFYNQPHQIIFSIIALTYAFVFEYRMEEAFRDTTSFPKLGRYFYVYYPIFDERNDLTRSLELETVGLSSKGRFLQEKLKLELKYSIFNILVMALWVIGTFAYNMDDGFQLILSGLIIQLLLDHNYGPMPVFDALQKYIGFIRLKRPVKGIQSINTWSSKSDWDGQGALAQAHFNLTHAYFKPLGKFLQKEFYKTERKKGRTIGQAQAITTVVKGAIVMLPLMMWERDNSRLPIILVLMTIGYLLHAVAHMVLEDEKFGLAKDRYYRRDDATKLAVFNGFQIYSSAVTYLCFTLPLVNGFAYRYGKNYATGPEDMQHSYGIRF